MLQAVSRKMLDRVLRNRIGSKKIELKFLITKELVFRLCILSQRSRGWQTKGAYHPHFDVLNRYLPQQNGTIR